MINTIIAVILIVIGTIWIIMGALHGVGIEISMGSVHWMLSAIIINLKTTKVD